MRVTDSVDSRTVRHRRRDASSGFSLIELLVVTGIFVILTGVVLANNTRFGNIIVLQNLAHEIALSIRQAQVYGIAVRRCDPTSTACQTLQEAERYNAAYGMHFTDNVAAFELFVDVDNDAHYDAGETVLAKTVTAGYRIDDLCITNAATLVETCNQAQLNVAFRRPEPDACIGNETAASSDFVDIDGPPGGDEQCVSSYGRARIILRSNRGDTAEVVIERTGQISAQ